TLAVLAGWHPDQLGEPRAEGTQRGSADGEAHLGHGQIASAEQGHRAFDASGHQVRVRRLTELLLEPATQMAGGHVHALGERADVERLSVVAVDPVPYLAQ